MIKYFVVILTFLITYILSAQEFPPDFYFDDNIEFGEIAYPNDCILIKNGDREQDFVYNRMVLHLKDSYNLTELNIMEIEKFGMKVIKQNYFYILRDTSLCVDTLNFQQKIFETKENIKLQKWLLSKPYCKVVSFEARFIGSYTNEFSKEVIDFVENKKNIIPKFGERQSEFSDEELIHAAYSKYQCPRGFHPEYLKRPYIHFLNARRIYSEKERQGRYYKLCADDIEQATEWIALAYKNGSHTNRILQKIDNEKYFEFRFVYPNQRCDQVHYTRIYKCNYFDSRIARFDSIRNEYIMGKINKKPITLEILKDLIEPRQAFKILSSFGNEYNDRINLYIYYIMVIYSEYGKGKIELHKKEYNVDKETGLLTLKMYKLREISGLDTHQMSHYIKKLETIKNPCGSRKHGR